MTDQSRNTRQCAVLAWATRAFGIAAATSVAERADRFLEEAIELYQAVGGDRSRVAALSDHVFSKPIGKIDQEIGGVGVTLLSLSECLGVSADYCEASEFRRVLARPIEHFRMRHNAKADAGVAMRVPE